MDMHRRSMCMLTQNRNYILDRGDRYIVYGNVEPSAVGLYENLSAGGKGYFRSEGGFFDVR